jgi:hypothetical protein
VTGGNGGPPGEPLAAFLDRRVREDPYWQELKARAPLLPTPSLEGLCPADWTVATVTKHFPTEWPDGESVLPQRVFAEARRKALEWGRGRTFLRIFVEDFLDPWGRGDLLLLGLRPDGVVETMRPNLRGSPFVVFRSGRFEPRKDQPESSGLPRYSELTVWPASVDLPTPPPGVEAAEPLLSPDPEWIDLKSELPSLPRFSAKALAAAKLHVASTAEIDACIMKIAELDGGRTDRRTIRMWGRHWLRQYKLADTTQDSLVKRFEDPEHDQRRRPEGNPQFHE